MVFKTTIGHEKQKEFFKRAFQKNHVHHAYSFAGPEHVGKTTFALDLAEALGLRPHLDSYVFDDEKGLHLEDARALQKHLSLTSPDGHYKFAIISYAERMSNEAGNALLKIIEEPPKKSIIILITSNFYALLPTIASRVTRVNFHKLSDQEIKKLVSNQEIVALSSGRPGLAVSLASSAEVYDFFQKSNQAWQTLNKGSLLERLKTAQMVASLESEQIKRFIIFAMENWVEQNGPLKTGQKLSRALGNLSYNINPKILLDNLFLP